ncbi:MAG: c-type cytochrome [Planctomycetia bacterium]|nr:c-type cytochrome [Planctomycetia bacterium]
MSKNRNGRFAAWQFAAAADMLDALARHDEALESLVDSAVSTQVAALISAARESAVDNDVEQTIRASAVRLFAQQKNRFREDLRALGELLVPQTPAAIQDAVISHLARQRSREVAHVLLANWKGHGPARRAQILSVLATRKDWIEVLLDNMEGGHVVSADIDIATRQRLATRKEADLSTRLEKLLALASTADRQEVLAQFGAAATTAGDLQRGATLFDIKCGKCHKIGEKGHEVGPNLLSLTNKTPQALLAAIFDPSQAVEPKYLNYTVITVDGLSYTGMLASETGNSITLLGPESKQQVILRNEVEAMQSTGKSMMPDGNGMEKELTIQGCVDILAFLAGVSAAAAPPSGN